MSENYLDNVSTAQCPISPGFAKAIVQDYMRMRWPDSSADEDLIHEVHPETFAMWVAGWLRKHGVQGWSKLRLKIRDEDLPSEEEIEQIREEGAQSA